ncbi:MAG: pentapeptide repeat-containing protein [Patescibacteria group bacterium]
MKTFSYGHNLQIVNDPSIKNYSGGDIVQIVLDFDLEGVSFNGVSFFDSRFVNTNLKNSKFHKIQLSDIIFLNCNLEGSTFYHTSFSSLLFIDCNLTYAKIEGFEDEDKFKDQYSFKIIRSNLQNTTIKNYDNCFEVLNFF